ncbi:hypothetical protein M422DRAFT_254682 [Sphaerobolus stellatus SS14]|uniref:Uncharacterized protein n=1 Tax=Sphaerobolus stellatus (strain SS14) TaxID=990650 RepID=A0A0C9UGT4_SPHS4|nr:hypothetical protein M422DRAFT_254682 [Sphaerobolus stellatus SS14]
MLPSGSELSSIRELVLAKTGVDLLFAVVKSSATITAYYTRTPPHASYAALALGNSTRKVHGVPGPVEIGIDVEEHISLLRSVQCLCNIERCYDVSDVESHATDTGLTIGRAGQGQF